MNEEGCQPTRSLNGRGFSLIYPEITDAREMAAYLSAIEGHAGHWCKINQPE